MDPLLTFWKAFGLFKEGNTTESIRELEMVKDRREISYAAHMALMYYHDNCRIVDHDAIQNLKYSSDSIEAQASDKDLMNCALFFLHIKELKRASKTISRVIESNPNNLNAVAVKGWIYLAAPKEEYVDKALEILDSVLNEENGGNGKHLDALLGRAAYYEKKKQYPVAIEIITEITIQYRDFTPAQNIKARLHIINGEWDTVLETISKTLMFEPNNIEAIRIYIFYLLSRETDDESLTEKFDELTQAFEQTESNNAELHCTYARLFSRICGRKKSILNRCMTLVEKACLLSPDNSDYTSELGYQLCLQGKYKEAFSTYQQAAGYDEGNMEPLYGMIYCRIKQDMIEDAQEQINLVTEIQASSGPKIATHYFLEGMIRRRQNASVDETVKLFDQSLNLHITSTRQFDMGFEFYTKLNADFLMELAREYMDHSNNKPIPRGAQLPRYLSKAIKLLENVLRQYPVISEARIQLAKAKWLSNDIPSALKVLHDCITNDPDRVEAHVMSAVINIEDDNPSAARNSLQQALSLDFKIRENPVFMMIKAQIEAKDGQWEQAKETLLHAYGLPGVKEANYSGSEVAG